MTIQNFRRIILAFFLIVFIVFAVYHIRLSIISDSKAPVISADTDTISASVNVTDGELLVGMMAIDNKDGDVTNTLVVASRSKFIKKGTLRVNYAAFDSSNNVGIYTRELTYTDYESPKFTITQPLHYLAGETKLNILQYISAYDCLDHNITAQIMYTLGDKKMVSDVASVQTLNLQVTNSAGDTAVLEVQIHYDEYLTYYTQTPHLKNYVMYVKVGAGKPDYAAQMDGIWAGNVTRQFSETTFDPTTDVSIDSSRVNLNEPGVYSVFYKLSRSRADGTRETLGTAELLVIVEE